MLRAHDELVRGPGRMLGTKIGTQASVPATRTVLIGTLTDLRGVALSVDFSSPSTLGGLSTFDPLDAGVAAWWRGQVDALYAAIPDFAGFVLKADSEGRVGPSTYRRSSAPGSRSRAGSIANASTRCWRSSSTSRGRP